MNIGLSQPHGSVESTADQLNSLFLPLYELLQSLTTGSSWVLTSNYPGAYAFPCDLPSIAIHCSAISVKVQNSTSAPKSVSHRKNLSIIPMTCAIPLVSGCNISGKVINSPFRSSISDRRNKKRSIHIRSITLTSTYPCELGVCGKNCSGVMSSVYQFAGISTKVEVGSSVSFGNGCIQSAAFAFDEKSIGWIGKGF